jgi:3-isopropylmalate dehydrogenase
VDAAAMFFVTDPARFDVLVTDNLFGDILTDLGAAISGGIGRADPTATVLSVALLLDHLGQGDQARRVEAAVAFDLATRDHAKPGSTKEIGDRLAALASQLA